MLLIFFVLCGGNEFDTTQLLLVLALFSSLDLSTDVTTTTTTTAAI